MCALSIFNLSEFKKVSNLLNVNELFFLFMKDPIVYGLFFFSIAVLQQKFNK